MKKIFISGPMTGLDGYNRESFHAAADHLRALGYDVRNPADLAIDWQDYSDYMEVALVMLRQCEGVIYLPGWHASKGALIERQEAERHAILDVSGLLRPIQNQLLTMYKKASSNV